MGLPLLFPSSSCLSCPSSVSSLTTSLVLAAAKVVQDFLENPEKPTVVHHFVLSSLRFDLLQLLLCLVLWVYYFLWLFCG